MSENNINVGGRLHSIATGNVLAGSDEILDDALGKKQSQVNVETYALVESVNNALASLSPEQQGALDVSEKANNNEVKLGYYVCQTEGNVAAKTIAAANYVLGSGGSIKIKMTNLNTANNATLNINSTGAKALYYAGERASATNSWEAGETVEVYYDGTSFYANNVAGGSGSGDGAFDISAKTGDTYETLSAALTAANSILSAGKKKGGMSIKFILRTNIGTEEAPVYKNEYVQYRLMNQNWSIIVSDWQGVDEEPTAGSKNLVESGGVANFVNNNFSKVKDPQDIGMSIGDLSISDKRYNILLRLKDGNIETRNFKSENTPLSGNIDTYISDLDFSDNNRNVVLSIGEGHIRTSKFNSKEITKRLEEIENSSKYSLMSLPGFDIALATQKHPNSSNTFDPNDNYSQFPILLHVTDVHGDSKRFKNAIRIGELLDVDCICNTGDTVYYHSLDDYSFVPNSIDKSKYVECLGNHDARDMIDEKSLYDKFYDYMKDYVVLDDNVSYPTWGYKDIADKKLRIIFLNQWECDGTSYHYYFNYSQEQMDFFVNALANTPADYGVIVMYHAPEYQSIVKDDTYNKFFAKLIDAGTSHLNGSPIRDTIDAFISRTSINHTYTKKNAQNFTITADFSGVDSSVEFIMCMNGHYHIDLIGYLNGATNKILQCNMVCTNAWINKEIDGSYGTTHPYFNEVSDLSRQIGTPNENAFNVYVIDRENGVIKVTRIGSQISNIDFSRRDCMVIPYK